MAKKGILERLRDGIVLGDGGYLLEVPYASEKELAMDILKHGAEVEVVGPKPLREEIAKRLRQAAGRYG